eukprot:6173707-Pleurochrysis_carterae.AAC.1
MVPTPAATISVSDGGGAANYTAPPLGSRRPEAAFHKYQKNHWQPHMKGIHIKVMHRIVSEI